MSINKTIYHSAYDGQLLHTTLYDVEQPKALVVILHGMADHRARYKPLAERLVKAHFKVLTIDQRGHGESLYDGVLKGYFADENGWQHNLEDIHQIIHEVNDQEKLPIILFGHSMGSLVARSYLKYYAEDLQALYLSGSPDESPIAAVGAAVAKAVVLFKGKKHPSPFLTKLSFGQFNKDIDHPKTAYDWLSVDEENVAAYIQDPLCGFDCTAQMFVDLLSGMEEVYHSKNWKIYNPQLPIKFESGRLDPCHKPNGIERAANQLEALGYQQVEFNYIDGCRHEIYNDIARAELMDSFVQWCDNTL